jgi:hypothetical protein
VKYRGLYNTQIVLPFGSSNLVRISYSKKNILIYFIFQILREENINSLVFVTVQNVTTQVIFYNFSYLDRLSNIDLLKQ